MERTQISLETEQAERLRALAQERGVSMAHLIREAIDTVYGVSEENSLDARWDRAVRAVGAGSGGGGNVAEDHDRYLDEVYGS